MDEHMIVKPASERDGETVQLSDAERRESKRRVGLRAAVVFETVRREGEQELERPIAALAFSGLAAGLSMGFSLIATGVIRAALPDAPWRVLIENFGYTLGFLIVVLGRQQLFTENTVTAVIPFLDHTNTKTFAKVARLWAIVLITNLLGALIVAFALARSDAFPPNVKAAFLSIGQQTLAHGFTTVLLKGIFAGWLIALMVWLLPAAENSRVSVILIITFIVGAAGLSHVVAGSVEAFYAVVSGSASWGRYLVDFLLPVFIGNSIGGVLLVSIINYGQVAPESDDARGY
ncbi:MAG: formate/nitrite transporter family protein [Vulcanimicrobiaceae bacterium]